VNSSNSAQAVNIRGYLAVFAALLLLTVATVGVASLELSKGTSVLVAVSIATIKATLVAMFFMHLKGEKPWVFWSLGLTAVLFAALFAFLLWTEGDHLFGTKFGDAFGSAAKTAPADGLAAPKSRSDEGGGH
jgi:cytochrome c oxidase subunit IV